MTATTRISFVLAVLAGCIPLFEQEASDEVPGDEDPMYGDLDVGRPIDSVRAASSGVGELTTGDGTALPVVHVRLGVGNPRDEQPWRGSVLLELRWFRPWTVVRLALTVVGAVLALAGVPLVAALALVAGEVVARWLFFVTVVPLNMPGSFWRHTVAGQR